ncbi:hypothetical protein SprV_0401584000 [Sparganum proliferum]
MTGVSWSTVVSSRLNPALILQAVNISPITTFGTCSLSNDIGLRCPCAILGADFLAAFDLLVECRQSRLHDKTTGVPRPPTFPIYSLSMDPEPKIHVGSSLSNFPVSPVQTSSSQFHHMTLFPTSGPLALSRFLSSACPRLHV